MARTDASTAPPDPAVLVLAPLGQDAADLLGEAEACGFAGRRVEDAASLERLLLDGGSERALFLVISQEGAGHDTGEVLDRVFSAEPDWARLPSVFLVSHPDNPPPACRMLDRKKNAPPFLVVGRPITSPVLRHIFRTLAESRERQFRTRDLLEQLRQEKERKQFLLSELRHRVRNSLSSLHAMFNISARQADSIGELANAFGDRLQALSQAYSQQMDAEGSPQELAGLFREQVGPYAQTGEQLKVSGPAVRVNEKVAFDLALIIHELATNAAKYGALSVPEGCSEVSWSVDPESGRLGIAWRERGGPTVVRPDRKGLGTVLVTTVSDPDAAPPRLEFDPAGLFWSVELSAPAFAFA